MKKKKELLRVLTHLVTRYSHTNQLTVAMEGNSDSIPCRSTLPGGSLRPVN